MISVMDVYLECIHDIFGRRDVSAHRTRRCQLWYTKIVGISFIVVDLGVRMIDSCL